MENKLTDNEIVKALECCRTNLIDDCKRCNLRLEDGTVQPFCTTTLIGLTLDLINRLQAKLDEAEDTIQFADKELKKAEAEVERLQNSIAVFTNNAVDFANEIDRHKKDKEEAFLFAANIVESEKIVIANAKAEAYKECIEKVNNIITEIYNKHIFGNNDLESDEKDAIINFSDDVTYAIDNLLKELVGE